MAKAQKIKEYVYQKLMLKTFLFQSFGIYFIYSLTAVVI